MTLDAKAAIQVAVTADDQLLLPARCFSAPNEALLHVESALADFRKGDSLASVVRVPGDEKVCSVTRRETLLTWLGPTLLDVWSSLLYPDGGPATRTQNKVSGVLMRPEAQGLSDQSSSPGEGGAE